MIGARTAKRVAGLLGRRRFARAPILVYRLRLGFLLGPRMLMLEHTGRHSGRRRYVVLEVIDRPDPGSYVVASGFGTRAQWLQNVMADQRVRVWSSWHPPRTGSAHVLTRAAGSAALRRYAAAHPRLWSQLRPVLEATLTTKIDLTDTDLPMVRIDT
ncbi:MAG: nitroreductase family deazaflavin-dependent oxidoreductase [Jatrophihabitans sp.]